MLTAIQLGILLIAYLAFLGNQTMTPISGGAVSCSLLARGVSSGDQPAGDVDPERRGPALSGMGASRLGPAGRGRGVGPESADDGERSVTLLGA